MANCLYNSIQLPELPTWDKTTYPYCYIYISGTNPDKYNIWCSKTVISYDDANSKNVTDTANGSSGYSFVYNAENDSWESKGDGYTFFDFIEGKTIVWCNHDMVNTSDNSVYLAASDPVIIPCKIDQRAFLIGYHIGLAGGPIPIGEPPVAVYDDEWPIEWNRADITDDYVSFVVPYDEPFVFTKISNLLLTAEELSVLSVTMNAIIDEECTSLTPIGSNADTGSNIFMGVYAFDASVILYLISCHTAGEESYMDGVNIPDTGLYYCLYVFNPEDIECIPISFTLNKQIYIPSGGIVVTPDSVTDGSVTHEIFEDYSIPVIKISDSLMQLDDLRASSMVIRDEAGAVTVIHTIGDYIDQRNQPSYVYVRSYDGVNVFRRIWSDIISVHDPVVAGDTLAIDPFPEAGVYVPVPDSGSAEYILRYVDRVYNGTELSAIDNVWPDHKTYPYSVIAVYNGLYCLYLLTKPAVFGPDNKRDITCLITSDACSYKEYLYTDGEGWRLNFDLSPTSANVSIGSAERESVLWTNHDIYNVDGTLYLAASEPTISGGDT